MAGARDQRRAALQALYQFDAGCDQSPELVRETLKLSDGGERTHDEAFALALAAWQMREQADAAVAELAPDWPTYRQPMIDRSILRLAYYEIVAEHAPPKVVINEAVELAREFSTEKSPLFLNGVLDKIYRNLKGAADEVTEGEVEEVEVVEEAEENASPHEDGPDIEAEPTGTNASSAGM